MRKIKILALVAVLALAFTVPAAVIARSDQPAQEQKTAEEVDEEELEEFEPSEQVNADEAISYPVDI